MLLVQAHAGHSNGDIPVRSNAAAQTPKSSKTLTSPATKPPLPSKPTDASLALRSGFCLITLNHGIQIAHCK